MCSDTNKESIVFVYLFNLLMSNIKYCIYLSVNPKRKILITGNVPTENLPTKSHEVPKTERRFIIGNDIQPSTSQEETTIFKHSSTAGMSTMEELIAHLDTLQI